MLSKLLRNKFVFFSKAVLEHSSESDYMYVNPMWQVCLKITACLFKPDTESQYLHVVMEVQMDLFRDVISFLNKQTSNTKKNHFHS